MPLLLPPAPGVPLTNAQPSYRYVWSDGEAQDEAAWVAFLSMVSECRAVYGDVVLVHFSPFEVRPPPPFFRCAFVSPSSFLPLLPPLFRVADTASSELRPQILDGVPSRGQ